MLKDSNKEGLREFVKLLTKAVPEIKDAFEDYNRIPAENEINVGPTEESSGAGAEKMIREYSEPAPQDGLAKIYDQISRTCFDASATKSMVKSVSENVTALMQYLAVGGRTVKGVNAALSDALIDLGVAKATRASAKKIKSIKATIKSLRHDLEVLELIKKGKLVEAITKSDENIVVLSKAEDEDEGEHEEEEEEHEEEEREEEEDEAKANPEHDEMGRFGSDGHKAKKDKKDKEDKKDEKDVEKAAKEDDEKDEKEDDEAAEKASEHTEAKAIAEMRHSIDVIAKSLGALSATGKAPSISAPEGAPKFREKLLKAMQDGSIPEQAWLDARHLLSQKEAVEQGKLDQTVFSRSLELAPESVKSVFSQAN